MRGYSRNNIIAFEKIYFGTFYSHHSYDCFKNIFHIVRIELLNIQFYYTQ